eukprot:905644-Amphidinium_carterae.2
MKPNVLSFSFTQHLEGQATRLHQAWAACVALRMLTSHASGWLVKSHSGRSTGNVVFFVSATTTLSTLMPPLSASASVWTLQVFGDKSSHGQLLACSYETWLISFDWLRAVLDEDDWTAEKLNTTVDSTGVHWKQQQPRTRSWIA